MIKIDMVSNGWILEDHSDPEFTKKLVFEHADGFNNSEKSEVETFVRLLWVLNDLIGPSTSRYSQHRVAIRIEKGDKCDDHLQDEIIERSDTTGASYIDG